MVLILNSQRPFLTTWYTFGKGGTLFATGWYNFGCENCTWWYLLFQLEKKGGDQMFQRGTDFFSIFLKYLVRENCIGWNQLLRDRSRTGQTGILIFVIEN